MRDFNASFDTRDATAAVNRLRLYFSYNYFSYNTSDGRAADYKHPAIAPLLSSKRFHQVVLFLRGRHVGCIDSISSHLPTSSLRDTSFVKSVYKEWLSSASTSSGRLDATSKMWRIMLCGRRLTHQNDLKQFGPDDRQAAHWPAQFVQWLESKSSMDGLLARSIIIATGGRCYFTALGGAAQELCYPTTKPSDEIWVIEGSKITLILRKALVSDEEKAALRPKYAWVLSENSEYQRDAEYEPAPVPAGY